MSGGNEDRIDPNDRDLNNSFLVVDKGGAFGVVYFATPWKQSPLVMEMGINEQGLSYDTNWIPKEKLTFHFDRKPKSGPPYEWAILAIMQECSSVEEVLSKIFTYNFGPSMEYQVHFADKSGDAVVIHPGTDGELTYTRKPKGNGYLISTNFNLVHLDKGNCSCRRYETARKMLSKIVARGDLTAELMASVLTATHQNDPLTLIKTIYSAIYDLPKSIIYLYYNRQFDKPYVIDVKQELAKTKRYRKISLKDLISDIERQKKK